MSRGTRRLGKSDVRIVYYGNVNKQKFPNGTSCISFYDGIEALLDCNYVELNFTETRVYFYPKEVKCKGSIKLTHKLSVTRYALMLKEFEGDYPLRFDSDKLVYYIDKHDKLDIERAFTNSTVPHPNYKAHTYEPYADELKATPENIVATVDESIKTLPVRKYSMTVYDGLLELLRIQILDLNKSGAYATLDTIKSLIADS